MHCSGSAIGESPRTLGRKGQRETAKQRRSCQTLAKTVVGNANLSHSAGIAVAARHSKVMQSGLFGCRRQPATSTQRGLLSSCLHDFSFKQRCLSIQPHCVYSTQADSHVRCLLFGYLWSNMCWEVGCIGYLLLLLLSLCHIFCNRATVRR